MAQNLPGAKTLKVIKASAGSGKTYRLTGEYLGLLFAPEGPEGRGLTDFRELLAVTFTVKATAEMKGRILSDLYAIGQGELPQKCTEIATIAGISEEEVRNRAPKILAEILRDYSSFRIQTIDSFFREIISAFSIELNHGGVFQIDFDTSYIVDTAADSLIRGLSHSDSADRGVVKWLRKLYMDALLRDSKTSVVQSTLRNFALKLLFSDRHLSHFMELELHDDEKLKTWAGEVESLKSSVMERIITGVRELAIFFKTRGLDPELTSRSFLQTLYFPFEVGKEYSAHDKSEILERVQRVVMDNVTLGKVVSERKGLLPKSKMKSEPGLYAHWVSWEKEAYVLLERLYSAWYEDLILFNDAKLLETFVGIYPVLRELKLEIDKFKRVNRLLTLTDINRLLLDITSSDSPFIYEKIGTTIHHFMIDEFQDTNPVQWENFAPLLHESLSKGNQNFLVGDVKQSIYRFRGTDSTLLGAKLTADPRFSQYVKEERLDTNWRSARTIVEFNNDFFDGIFPVGLELLGSVPAEYEYLVEQERELYRKSYEEELRQIPHKDSEGYVSISSFEEFMAVYGDKLSRDEGAKIYLKEMLVSLYRRGYKPGDIAILTRKRNQAAAVAQMLTEMSLQDEEGFSYDFRTDEALRVSNSTVVLLLVVLIRAFAYPMSDNSAKEMAILYARLGNMYPEFGADGANTREMVSRLMSIPAHGSTLYEIVSEALTLLGPIPDKEQIYVNGFLDILLAFSSRYVSVASKFIDWWDQVGNTKSITMSGEERDAITIATIHMTKGLEYPIVLLPYCDWEIIPHASISSREVIGVGLPEELSSLGFPEKMFMPQNSKLMRNSHFAPDLIRVHMEEYVDNLNLLYVAFTRASVELHMLIDDSSSTPNVGTLISSRCEDLTESLTPLDPFHVIYSRGEPTQSSFSPADSDSGHLTLSGFGTHEETTSLSLSADDYMYYSERQAPRRDGILRHRILSHIYSHEDVEPVLQMYRRKGDAYRDAADFIAEKWSDISRSPYALWFDPNRYQILIEQSLSWQEQVVRPDRIMISHTDQQVIVVDYKFGYRRTEAHLMQIRGYINALRSAGFTDVRGFLWYSLSDSPLEVS